jgi:hypothetical protein
MTIQDRSPGWDKREINRIARTLYGGLEQMFAVHGWATDGRTFGQIAPSRVVETYGSVKAFARAHEDGLTGNAVLDPYAAVAGAVPDVWLNEWISFSPDTWGCDGFTEESWRNEFIRDSRPGALMVCYVEENGVHRIAGIVQLSHRTGEKWQFISSEDAAWARENHPDEWNYAVKVIRAWKVADDAMITVEQFAPDTFTTTNKDRISLRGMKLTRQEALKVLDLPLQEVAVWNHSEAGTAAPDQTEAVIKPSRPGPVSQIGFFVREAEGTKHLYILELKGDPSAFLGRAVAGEHIVKVGFSVSPNTRRDAHNSTLPKCAFEWEILHSTACEGADPYPSSKHALAGEAAMKACLNTPGQSLGGEFFLANREAITAAWSAGKAAAKNLKS